MWDLLRARNLGYKFRREHPVGRYRLDFYCAEAKVAVEMDGEQHDPHKDGLRDAELAELGIVTYRIPNRRFFAVDIGAFVDDLAEIVRICDERTGRV